jgi:uncharacterized protein YbjT (DUF2867 family)
MSTDFTSGRPVLVAGASGTIGRAVARALHARGDRVRALNRRPERAHLLRAVADEVVSVDATDPQALTGVCDDVDAVVSCLGAPMALSRDRRSFHAMDTVANSNLVAEAARAGVRRFVYLSVFLAPGWRGTRYVRAHEAVVDDLRARGMSHAIVRPTGMFANFDPWLAMARRGVAWVPGDGRARTNPVHPSEVAAVCVEALDRTDNASIDVGGPEVVTREEIARLAFAALGRTPRIMHVPPLLLRAAARVTHPLHPHLSEVLEFGTAAFTHDFVAPGRGHDRIADHFARLAAQDRALARTT